MSESPTGPTASPTQAALAASGSSVDGCKAASAASAATGAEERILRFNVGGARHMCRRSTVFSRGANFLTALIANDESGAIPAARDTEGDIFIDRNREAFCAVLEYLRTGRVVRPTSLTPEQLARELDFYGVLDPVTVQNAPFFDNVERWRRRAADWVDANRPSLMKTLASAAAAGYDRHTFQFVLDSAKSHYFATGLTSIIAEKEAQSVLFRRAVSAHLQRELGIGVRTSFHEGFYSSVLKLEFDWACLVGSTRHSGNSSSDLRTGEAAASSSRLAAHPRQKSQPQLLSTQQLTSPLSGVLKDPKTAAMLADEARYDAGIEEEDDPQSADYIAHDDSVAQVSDESD